MAIKNLFTLLISSLLFGCAHYEAQIDNRHDSVNNRYSQNNIVLLVEKKKPFHQINTTIKRPTNSKSKLEISSYDVITSKKKISKPIPASTQDESSTWEKLITLFIPEKIKPWQKSILAQASMKPGGLVPDSEKFNQKIFSSKESSRGGNGVAGGGCGCN